MWAKTCIAKAFCSENGQVIVSNSNSNMFLVPSISFVKFQEDWLIKSLPLGIKYKFPPTHVKTRNKVWIPWIISILICLTAQIR